MVKLRVVEAGAGKHEEITEDEPGAGDVLQMEREDAAVRVSSCRAAVEGWWMRQKEATQEGLHDRETEAGDRRWGARNPLRLYVVYHSVSYGMRIGIHSQPDVRYRHAKLSAPIYNVLAVFSPYVEADIVCTDKPILSYRIRKKKSDTSVRITVSSIVSRTNRQKRVSTSDKTKRLAVLVAGTGECYGELYVDEESIDSK